ncbi:MAG TPA: hypothetical protein VKA46_37895 [Gemmataceae bacterium]|nr:hypothetical protein [Gemmataceae bacterium]
MSMWKRRQPSGFVLLFLGLLGLGAGLIGALAADGPADVKGEDLKPKWNVDDSWVIETTTKVIQARNDLGEKKPAPINWKLTVKKAEKVAGHECHRLDVACLDDKGNVDKTQPGSVLWIDQKSMALRQLQTQLPVPGGFRTITESYAFGDNQPAPVTAPLTALVLDVPLFTPGATRGLEKFSYEAVSGAGGKRAANDVAFAVDIEQHITPAKEEDVKRLVSDEFKEFNRDLKAKPVVEVKLKTSEREVRQLWQVGQPWPLYANNGQTTARLIKVTLAQPKN